MDGPEIMTDTWDVEHKPSGHKYTLYEKLTNQEAHGLLRLMSKNDNLVLAMSDARTEEERKELDSQRHEVAKEIANVAYMISRRCLHLSKEEIDKIPTK